VPLIFFTGIEEVFVLPKRLLIYFGTFIYLIGILINRDSGFPIIRKGNERKFDFLVVGYILLVLLSFLVSEFPYLGLYELLDFIPFMVLFFIWRNSLDLPQRENGINLLIIAGVLASGYAILQKMGWDFVQWQQADLVKTRSIGTLGNPDFLAGFLVLILPLALAGVFYQPRRRYFNLFAVFIIGISIVLSYCRGGWVALVAGTLVFLFWGWSRLDKKKLVPLIAVCLIIPLMVTGVEVIHQGSLINRLKNPVSMKDPSVAARLHLWKVAGILALKKPLLGWGAGSFSYLALQYRKDEPLYLKGRLAVPEKAHNDLLELAVASGIPALLLFLIVLGFSFVKIRQKIKEEPDKWIFWAGVAGSLTAIIVQGFFVYSTLPVSLAFWFLLGLIHFNGREKGGKLWPALFGILVLGGLLLSAFNLIADYYFRRYLLTDIQASPKTAVKYIDRAIAYYPYQSLYHLNKGKMLESLLHKEYSPELFVHSLHSYQAASNLNPLNPYPFADMGRLAASFMEAGKNMGEISILAYREALVRDPYNAFFYNDLGNIYLQTGDNENAILQYKKSLEIYPDSTQTLVNLARAYLISGQNDLARRNIDAALKLDPESQRALELIKYIKKGE